MTHGKVNYKALGSSCEVYVRQLSPNSRQESRLIANFRRNTKPSAGFIVDLDYTFAVRTLVEMDVKFPGQSFYYRARGVVERRDKGTNPERPYRLGIRIIAMEKLDPTGVPMAPPKQKTLPYSALSEGDAPHISPQAAMPEMGPSGLGTDDVSPMPVSSTGGDEPPAQAQAASPGSSLSGESTELKLPKPREISELLTSLIGEPVAVSKNATKMIELDDMAVAGDYRGEDGSLFAVVVTDIALANWLGASLAMIPKGVAQKDLELLNISEEARENTQEIFNINTSVLNAPDLPHHRFGKLYFCLADEQPDDVRQLMEKHASRIDFDVEVPGYGGGQMAYLLGSWHRRGKEATAAVASDTAGEAEPPIEQPPVDSTASGAESANVEATPVEDSSAEKAAEKPRYQIQLPKPREISELLTNLVGEAVLVKAQKDQPLDVDDFVAVGDFLDDEGDPKGICAMDINLSNWVAAALAMIPKDVAKKDIENWKLSDESRENIQEIFNISASVFNKPTMPHLRFGALSVGLDGSLPAPITAIVENTAGRVDFSVEIPGYGNGILSCIFKAL